MKSTITRIFFFSILIAGALACSSTKIIGSWKNADSNKTFSHIMVVGLSSNVVAQSNVESRMATILSARGVNAKGSGAVFSPDMKITDEMKKTVSSKLKEQGFDGLLTIALVSIDDKTSYTPGTVYSPYAYPAYGSYWGYYGYYAPQVYSPGYYSTERVYTVEANLYDVDTEKLVWAARSETTDPASLDRFSEEYSQAVVYQLAKDGMLGKKSK